MADLKKVATQKKAVAGTPTRDSVAEAIKFKKIQQRFPKQFEHVLESVATITNVLIASEYSSSISSRLNIILLINLLKLMSTGVFGVTINLIYYIL